MNKENIGVIALLSLVIAISIYYYSFNKMIWKLEDMINLETEVYQFELLEGIPLSAEFISPEVLEVAFEGVKSSIEILE